MTDPDPSYGDWPVPPAIQAARARAESVAPGRMVHTTLSGSEATELMGLEGRSYIVKLPEPAPSNTSLFAGGRWYIDGQPVDDPPNPRYIEWPNDKSRAWLIDVCCIFNLFAAVTNSEVAVAHRHRSLDAHGWGRSRRGLRLPVGVKLPDGRGFTPMFSMERDVCLGENIPFVALIIPTTIPVTRRGRDLLTIAREDSAVSYVWSVKFEGK